MPLFLVASLLLVVRPGATSSVFAPSSDERRSLFGFVVGDKWCGQADFFLCAFLGSWMSWQRWYFKHDDLVRKLESCV